MRVGEVLMRQMSCIFLGFVFFVCLFYLERWGKRGQSNKKVLDLCKNLLGISVAQFLPNFFFLALLQRVGFSGISDGGGRRLDTLLLGPVTLIRGTGNFCICN